MSTYTRQLSTAMQYGRWLLVASCVLAMCSCRAPLTRHNPASPPPIAAAQSTESSPNSPALLPTRPKSNTPDHRAVQLVGHHGEPKDAREETTTVLAQNPVGADCPVCPPAGAPAGGPIQFMPAIPRVPYPFSAPGLPPNAVTGAPDYYSVPVQGPLGVNYGQWRPDDIPAPWPRDEYLTDGGDRNTKTHISPDFTIHGLDVEDTIAHYDTIHGKTEVAASNKTPIYAPRFFSVRKVYGLDIQSNRMRVGGLENPQRVVSQQRNATPSTTLQREQLIAQNGAKLASVFRDRTRAINVARHLLPTEFNGNYGHHEDFAVIRSGTFNEAEKARLANSLLKAAAWTNKDAVGVLFDGIVPSVEKTAANLGVTYTYDRPDGKSEMRVLKVASKSDARSGEIVEFTIRFDNVGAELVGNVTILDNLTTRLKYIPDSAQCSLEANFFANENEAGSEVLRWEIINPIKPKEGGVIRFKCKVR